MAGAGQRRLVVPAVTRTTSAARCRSHTTDSPVRPCVADVFAMHLVGLDVWAVGVVSRTSVRWPHLILAHLFARTWSRRPTLGQLPMLSAEGAVLVCRVSDLALRDGLWPIVGSLPRWRVDQWPMPRFAVPPHGSRQSWQEEVYAEDDPGHRTRLLVSHDQAATRRLPEGGVAAATFAEYRLAQLLRPRLVDARITDGRGDAEAALAS